MPSNRSGTAQRFFQRHRASRCAGAACLIAVVATGLAAPAAVAQAERSPAAAPTSAPTTHVHVPDPVLVITGSGISVDLRAAWEVAKSRVCVVCGKKEGRIENSELHKGALVPVCEYCVDAYRANPDLYFAGLQPRAALFQDDYAPRRPLRWFTFALGCYAVFGLVCAGVAGSTAVRRGQRAWPLVLAGLFATVVGLAWALSLPRAAVAFDPESPTKVRHTRPPVRCAGCGTSLHPSIAVCAVCGRARTPTAPSEVDAVRAS